MSISETEAQRRRVANIDERLVSVEQRVQRLEGLADVLRREAVNTRKRIREVERNVGGLLDAQTAEIKLAIAQADTLNADRLRQAVSQWPPSAVVFVTAALALIVGIILLLTGAIHFG